jgi:7-carboxy-7-deazaguanine synthase
MLEQSNRTNNHSLIVNEIFHSIQGESTHAGRPCVFVRLTYCNLRCSYCDTAYAFEAGTEIPIDEILQKVSGYDCRLVEVTGGEPLFQPNVHELLARLCDKGFEVLLETGGSIDISSVDVRVKRIVDFKCPSSGMMMKNVWENVRYLKRDDEVKFVIGTHEDYEWACGRMHEYGIDDRCTVLMSPVLDVLEPVQLAGWILKDRCNVRFQIQIHKYIWHSTTRGV